MGSMDLAQDPLIPPVELMFDGTVTAEQFAQVGGGFTHEYLIRRARLKPNERVLDLGCGIGQKARVLTTYLGAGGSYEGIDIVPKGIEWCRSAYADFRNFHFTLADDLYSSHYNPAGKILAKHYRLPYGDAEFDLVFLASVFTHLMPDEVAHYLSELSRVLKPDGRCVASAFLLNSETRPRIDAGKTNPVFLLQDGDYGVIDQNNPTMGILLDEAFLRRAMAANNLRICEITYGFWSGQADLLKALQDCVIALKGRDTAASDAITSTTARRARWWSLARNGNR
jgi:ubiquinone/menaquinone biosynthesis C-methylase UbiE